MAFQTKSLALPALLLALLLGACSAPTGGPGGPASTGTFKFGVVTPLSGGGADYGTAYQNGIKLAVDEVNQAGGISVGSNKHQLEPVFCDDEFKPDKAVNCGKKLASENKVKIIQTPASSSAFPLMGFNEQDGFLLMATSQTPRFTTQGNKLVVRYMNNTDRTMGPWVGLLKQYLQQNNKRISKVGVMEVNTELGKSWVDNFNKEWSKNGGSVTGKASYDANATDFYPQLTTLLPQNPDALVLTTVCQPSSIVIKQARELGFKGIFINSAACSGEELVKLLPADQLEGTLLEVGAWGIPDGRVVAFQKAYRAKFNAEPQLISGVGYEGVRWLAKALEGAGTLDDVNKIRAAMPGALSGLKNMFDMSNLDNNGDLDFPMYVGTITGGKLAGFKG